MPHGRGRASTGRDGQGRAETNPFSIGDRGGSTLGGWIPSTSLRVDQGGLRDARRGGEFPPTFTEVIRLNPSESDPSSYDGVSGAYISDALGVGVALGVVRTLHPPCTKAAKPRKSTPLQQAIRESQTMHFDDVILGRRSIRGYKPDPVPREENMKLTLSLSRRSLDFFKREAKKRHVTLESVISASQFASSAQIDRRI